MASLLAVDVGLKTGVALFDECGRLVWYRSRKVHGRRLLRKVAYDVLRAIEDLHWLVLEGGGDMADVWRHEAGRRDIPLIMTTAEEWRPAILHQRERRSGADAKSAADGLARAVIEWSGAPRPTSLRPDVAEAILVGLWGVLRVGWLEKVPDAIRQPGTLRR